MADFSIIPLPVDAEVTGCSADFTRFCGYRVTHSEEKPFRIMENGSEKVETHIIKHYTSYVWDDKGKVIAVISDPDAGSIFARGMSSDGSTIVGDFFSRASLHGVLFRWTAESGMTRILDDRVSSGWSPRLVLSRDGRVIGGSYNSPTSRVVFVWSQDRGVQYLKPVDKTYTECAVLGISGDGSVIGRFSDPRRSNFDPGKYKVFRWSDENGYYFLPKPLANGNFHGRDPFLISEDGSTVAGPFVYGAPVPFDFDWCVWKTDGSMTKLQAPGAMKIKRRNGGRALNKVSADGNIITGCFPFQATPLVVFYFQRDTRTGLYKYHDLSVEWTKRRYPIEGLKLWYVMGISKDGKHVLCVAKDKQGAARYLIGRI